MALQLATVLLYDCDPSSFEVCKIEMNPIEGLNRLFFHQLYFVTATRGGDGATKKKANDLSNPSDREQQYY